MTNTYRTLVLGGARSGKSAHAEDLVCGGHLPESSAPIRYLATARRDVSDADWESRIDQHRNRRPSHWSTVETADAGDLAAQLESDSHTATLVDDLGTWLTTELDRQGAWDAPRGTVTPAAASKGKAAEPVQSPLAKASLGGLSFRSIGPAVAVVLAALVLAGAWLMTREAGAARQEPAVTEGEG